MTQSNQPNSSTGSSYPDWVQRHHCGKLNAIPIGAIAATEWRCGQCFELLDIDVAAVKGDWDARSAAMIEDALTEVGKLRRELGLRLQRPTVDIEKQVHAAVVREFENIRFWRKKRDQHPHGSHYYAIYGECATSSRHVVRVLLDIINGEVA